MKNKQIFSVAFMEEEKIVSFCVEYTCGKGAEIWSVFGIDTSLCVMLKMYNEIIRLESLGKLIYKE